MHEGIANHFSLRIKGDGNSFLMNQNKQHFSRIRASDLLLLDTNVSPKMNLSDSPDPTAWSLHGAVHRHCPHAICIMHVHPIYSTVLATLADSRLPPIDQRSVMFYKRYVIDEEYGGLAFKNEGERCASQLSDQKFNVMIMGNHGLLVIGEDVADTFNRLYYFELAAETYIKALWTGKPLRVMPDRIAEKAVSYALTKTSGVAAISDESNQIECIDFEKIKGGKPFDYKQQWFNDMLIKIGQKR